MQQKIETCSEFRLLLILVGVSGRHLHSYCVIVTKESAGYTH